MNIFAFLKIPPYNEVVRILSVETSCDETSFALVEATGGLSSPKFKILKHLVASQIKIHAPFGGVVPNLAKREHLVNLPILYQEIKDCIGKKKLDAIAVTVGPGLEPALWTGIGFAKQIHKDWKKINPEIKLIGVNHMEGHLYSFLLSQKTRMNEFQISSSELKKLFPAIALVVSGGHTILLKLDSITKRKRLGETRDDAVGEAFDKVARMLSLSYPGGPEIENHAKLGNPRAIELPRPMMHDKNYDFSFSGLKTSVLYYLRDHKNANIDDVAASFQQAVIDVFTKKIERATIQYKTKTILLSGGVAANRTLREALEKKSKELKCKFLAPSFEFNTDNGAMIAIAAYINILQKKNRRLTADGTMNL